ncbi:MAG: DNA primase catalytic subunit PriS [Thermoplasmatales archaeon]|nr:DNA primase catalytic subunit PriS [Thermoplasmatales archaeon]
MNFLKRKFFSYYIHPKIIFPSRIERREYAFIPFGGEMHRHLAFSSREKILDYLKSEIPAHAYYSSAYYSNPSAERMDEKKWMGADLIFDLDADHLPNSDKMSYEESLEEVKKEAIKLLSFLTDDFGFSENEIEIYFSGSRGYHFHVKNSRILSLGAQERREIVDYVTGRGLIIENFLKEKVIPRGKFTDKTIEIDIKEGWKKRFANALANFFKEIKTKEKKEAINELVNIGASKKTAEEIYDLLTDERIKRIEEGKIDQATPFKRIIKPLIEKIFISLQSGADEPVTSDIKRLIRLPGSLHGKSGLRVAKVESIEDFEPLRDAVVFGEEEVEVNVFKPFKIRMMENNFDIKEGKEKLPEYLAVFLIARGFATI